MPRHEGPALGVDLWKDSRGIRGGFGVDSGGFASILGGFAFFSPLRRCWHCGFLHIFECMRATTLSFYNIKEGKNAYSVDTTNAPNTPAICLELYQQKFSSGVYFVLKLYPQVLVPNFGRILCEVPGLLFT